MDVEPNSSAVVRKVWLGGGIAILLAALYSGGVIFSRWHDTRTLKLEATAKTAMAQRTQAQRSVDALGGAQFGILSFYAMPGAIHRGETAQLCYGVSNAQKVSIVPDAGHVWPSYSRCVPVSPTEDTTYTLTAKDSKGTTKIARVFVVVRVKSLENLPPTQ
jgi:hypothetical protein